jgi:plasmid stabilization system protein ParE
MAYTLQEKRAFAEHWIAAWNDRDLDRIVSHYADAVEFEAATVVRRWQRSDGRLHGIAELREHFRIGLELVPNLHFSLEEILDAPSGYAVLYRRENGNRVLDAVELDANGKAIRVTAFYLTDQS